MKPRSAYEPTEAGKARRARYYAKKEPDALTKAIYNVFARHGLPLHYQNLAIIAIGDVEGRSSVAKWKEFIYSTEFKSQTARVLNRLVRHKELFENLGGGVFWLAGKRQERTYPEI